MARKMHPDESRPDDGRDDISVIHSKRQVPIAGQTVVVAEYEFEESLELRPLTNLIVQALYQAFKMKETLDADEVLDVLAPHADVVATLVARAAHVDEAWVRKLGALDTENIVLTWWAVNRDFFVESATRRLRLDRVKATDGPTSTQPSSPTGTAAPSSSDATHAAS
ncbi:DUF6631 family protein [Dyella terrae]|uniref:DUF6631 family protein n=1 Tax=Dyella terrae TaxID=522259 RepID=UPI001EFE129D|nr:DUF6631 family protein [Dyella terrae]ULU26592.1 hypothetical protein DYST_03538 [Dyella terrae]